MNLSRRILRAAWAGVLLGTAARTPAVEAEAASAAPPSQGPDRPDDEAFRRGLRERGLIELLDLFDREHPAADGISQALRLRETLLRACDDAQRSAKDRADACRRALDILEKLVAENPNHPDRFAWRLEMGRDLVERQSAPAVEALLFRFASPKQRDEIAATADRAIAVLQRLTDDIAAEWQRLGTLPPEQFEQLSAANRPKELASSEAAGAYLLAWARLYRAMVLPNGDARRAELLSQATDEVATRRRWTIQPHEKTGLQMQSLVLASIAQRLANKLDAADAASQQAIGVYSQTSDPQRRRALDSWALLAVLERIRLLADRGQPAEALAAVGRAYEWARKTRPNDLGAVIALAVLERSIATASGQPARDEPLASLLRTRPDARPLIYESLGRLARTRGDAPPTVPDKLGLVWVCAEDCANLDAAVNIARSLCDTRDDTFVAAEGLFLLARCEAARSRPTAAAQSLIRLARECPSSDRAATAVDEAVRLAAEGVTATGSVPATQTQKKAEARESAAPTTSRATTQGAGGSPNAGARPTPFVEARETFVDAMRLLREKSPDNPRLPEATFAMAVALQQIERWNHAANEFAKVPATHELAAEAALRRAQCLVRQFEAGPDERAATDALRAADDARRRLESLPEPKRNPCWTAEAILLRAGIQAHPAVRQPDAALATLDEFETRYSGCREAIGAMWRVRLNAMESLDRLEQANTLVDRVIAAEPDRVGPVMIRLLTRMQEKIERLRDDGDALGVRALAGEAAALADKIERWAAERSPAAASTARLARAMALLDADRPDEARKLAEGQPTKDIDWQFIRAECLYRSNAYRDALPVFNGVWKSAEEGGRLWWRALLRNLQCHTEIGTDPDEILQSIRQYQHHHKDMGGPAMQREFETLRKRNEQRKAAR